VRVARERLGPKEVEIGFAADHANSRMVLPGVFNGVFQRGQRRAVEVLEGVLRVDGYGGGGSGGGKGRRRSK